LSLSAGPHTLSGCQQFLRSVFPPPVRASPGSSRLPPFSTSSTCDGPPDADVGWTFSSVPPSGIHPGFVIPPSFTALPPLTLGEVYFFAGTLVFAMFFLPHPPRGEVLCRTTLSVVWPFAQAGSCFQPRKTHLLETMSFSPPRHLHPPPDSGCFLVRFWLFSIFPLPPRVPFFIWRSAFFTFQSYYSSFSFLFFWLYIDEC